MFWCDHAKSLTDRFADGQSLGDEDASQRRGSPGDHAGESMPAVEAGGESGSASGLSGKMSLLDNRVAGLGVAMTLPDDGKWRDHGSILDAVSVLVTAETSSHSTPIHHICVV